MNFSTQHSTSMFSTRQKKFKIKLSYRQRLCSYDDDEYDDEDDDDDEGGLRVSAFHPEAGLRAALEKPSHAFTKLCN